MLGRLLVHTLQLLLGIPLVESLSSHSVGCGWHPPVWSSLPPIELRQPSRTNSHRSSQRQRTSFLSSSRQKYRDGSEDDSDDYDDGFPNTKFREVSEEEIGLRRMPKSSKNKGGSDFPQISNERRSEYEDEDEEDDYYFEDDRRRRPSNGRRRENSDRSSQRTGRLARYDYEEEDEDEDDFYGDDEEEGGSDQVAGNYWSNPINRMDRPPSGINRRGRRDQRERRFYEDDEYADDDYDDDDNSRSRRPRRRPREEPRRRKPSAPVSSGLGEPPRVLKDLYDQLFWYGFDADDTADVGDKTAFGGTKGKFNGFNYILPEQSQESSSRSGASRRPPMDSARRLPPSETGNRGAITRDYDARRRRAADMDYYDDDEEEDYESDYYSDDSSSRKRRPLSPSLYKPPTDETSVRKNRMDDNYYEDDYDDDYDDGDEDYERYNGDYRNTRRTSRRRNSARFDGEDDEYMDRRSGGRRRRRQQYRSSNNEWSPLNMIESFLGLDRDEMNYKADMYDAKMGLGKRRRRDGRRRSLPQQQRRSPRDDPGRPGYAYRYEAEDDDDEVLDVDLAYDDVDDVGSGAEAPSRSAARRRQLQELSDAKAKPKRKTKEQTWEERQIAMERVPPANVVAWGPAGELAMSAREKAFLDAQEDIETARRKLNAMKQKESEAKDEISVLKVDAERQRLKLEDAPMDRRSRRDLEELRQTEMDIDDASRELRRCRARVERAVGVLEELEQRHYAIMSCYNVGQASMLVGESLNEISSSIPGSEAPTASAAAIGNTAEAEGSDSSSPSESTSANN